jgi:hypothetical protein
LNPNRAPERAPHDPFLLVGLSDRRVQDREVGLHFDHDHREELGASTQHVDRTTLTVLRVGRLNGDVPVQGHETADDLGNQPRMLLVEQSVQLPSPPRNDRLPASIECREDLPQRRGSQTRAVAALDQGNRLLGDATS